MAKKKSHLKMNIFCHFNFAIKEEITLAGASQQQKETKFLWGYSDI